MLHAPQVLVGSRDNPHVDLKSATAAQTFELLFLKNAEPFWLQRKRKISDFIQKQCSAVSRLKAPHRLRHRTREGAQLMAEQLALQQSARNRDAIELGLVLMMSPPPASRKNRPPRGWRL